MPKVATLRVTDFLIRGKTRWRVCGPKILAEPGQKEFRGPARRTKREAEDDLYLENQRLVRLQHHIPDLTATQRLDAERAFELIRDSGRSLEEVVRAGLVYFTTVTTLKNCSLAEAWERGIIALAQENTSEKHQQAAKYMLRFSIVHEFPGLDTNLRELDPEMIRQWLAKLPNAPSTKRNWLAYAKLMAQRALLDGYTEKNAFMLVKAPKVDSKPVAYLTPSEALSLLKAVDSKDIPVVVFSLFAGLRPQSEVVDYSSTWTPKLMWEHVDWENKEIHIGQDRTKTGRHRVVPMEETLIRWLDHVGARDRRGFVAVMGLRKRIEQARKDSGLKLAHDVLRHTYATMWLAKHRNKAQLAENMGNSPAVIDQHYRHPVSSAIADGFWRLNPSDLVSDGHH